MHSTLSQKDNIAEVVKTLTQEQASKEASRAAEEAKTKAKEKEAALAAQTSAEILRELRHTQATVKDFQVSFAAEVKNDISEVRAEVQQLAQSQGALTRRLINDETLLQQLLHQTQTQANFPQVQYRQYPLQEFQQGPQLRPPLGTSESQRGPANLLDVAPLALESNLAGSLAGCA